MKPFATIEKFGRELDRGPLKGKLFFFDSQASKKASNRDSGKEELPPILFIHGLGDEADSFRHVLPILARKQRVLAMDLPGFGRSKAEGKVTIRYCAKAALDLLEAETPDGAIVAGSSLGAAVAERVAFKKPDLVRGLVLMDGGLPMPPATSVNPSSLFPGLGERYYRAYRDDPKAAYESLRPYYADLDALPEADRDFLAVRVQERVGSESQLRAYFSLFRSLALTIMMGQGGYQRKLSRWGQPLAVIWGEKDSVVPPSGVDLLMRVAPYGRSRVIAGAGHLPHQERPEETAAAIRELLAESTKACEED